MQPTHCDTQRRSSGGTWQQDSGLAHRHSRSGPDGLTDALSARTMIDLFVMQRWLDVLVWTLVLVDGDFHRVWGWAFLPSGLDSETGLERLRRGQ